MKIPLSWLRDHLETGASVAAIAETLTAIGLEVEAIVDPGAALAPFVTARVIEAVQHPNADRLRVCRVDAGGEEITVVCGAPNARTGLHAVLAPPGAVIPGSGITLKVGEIRGVQSAGMLVSARELGLGDDHEGIIELPGDAPVGIAYAQWAGLNDPVIEIGVTPNRGDALSMRGVARDLAAAGLGVLKPWAPKPVAAAFPSPIAWANTWPQACPWVLGRAIRGVRNGPSPDWLQRRLLAIGLRPISALVDITNFFTFDIGRPLHVFDADRLRGGVLTLRPGGGESFRALNGRDYTAGPDDLVIADAAGVQSLAGVIGGEATGSSEATTTVFIECGLFDPVRVALSGRRHQLTTDARQRFERGINPSLLPSALDAATAMVIALCGGEPSETVSAGAEPAWQREASLRFRRLAELGGAEIAPDEATAILQRLGFTLRDRNPERVTVAVPPWRRDVAAPVVLDQAEKLDPARAGAAAAGACEIEPECDLIEEVLRIHGIDRIAPVSLPRLAAVPAPALTPRQSRTALARRLLGGRGLAECVSFSFLPRDVAAQFGDAPETLHLVNPIAADLDQMRPTPLASLALAAHRHAARGAGEAAIFEIGAGFSGAGQTLIGAGLRAAIAPRHWQGGTAPDATAAKADLLAVLAGLGAPMDALSVTADAPAHYHPGRSGVVRQGPKIVLGYFGALHPRLDLDAVGFELFLDAIADPKRRRRAPPDLPALQPVRRDFAFVVPENAPAEPLLRAIRTADRGLIERVTLFDVYQGENVPAGTKSLGVEVTIQPRERTLTDAEIEALSAKIVAATGATLRS